MVYLYDKFGEANLGVLDDVISCFVTEERNGMFELELEYPNGYPLSEQLQTENIIICDANDTLKSQKFRIYDTQKLMDDTIIVFARHISFDLMYDYIDSLSFENQSCEYALNQLFRKSSFSTHYKGYSDIVNAQKFNVNMLNILEAIGGKSGSIIDTFGTGAEILRDNENIHVLNKRGYDNEVSIEYSKNLTGFELEEDTTELTTRILPYAIYRNEDDEEIIVKADYVDSPLIDNYSHPYIKHIDYSDRFNEDNIPNISKLQTLAQNEYRDNKVDIPKQNFKIEFIPLSKCVGFEGLEDKISLCDIVTIKDVRYNINTQAKVVKVTFNVLKNRYESMELGEPKMSLGDVIGGGGNETVGPQGPQGPQGPPGADGEAGDFPNTLPNVPVVEAKVYGFSNIEISWTFENEIYYQYELYASKVKDFVPNIFDLMFQGQASSYMFQANPDETWYFKVCAINTHGDRTEFSNQVVVTTTKISDLSNYVDNMAIGDALIGQLSLDRGWIGKLNANLLDVKGNFSVTDGNGKRTLDIDSFGNIHIDAKGFKMDGKSLNLEQYVTITDLKTGGSTIINGDNIQTGTLKGVLLQTYADNANKGVRISKDSMSLGNTTFYYYASDEFRISSDEMISLGTTKDIYLMPRYGSSDGFVVIPNATLRTQKLNVVDDTNMYGNLAVSGSVSANSFKVGNNLVYHAGNKPTPSEIGASPSSHTHSYLPLGGGTVNGTLTVSGSLYTKNLADGNINWWVLSGGTIYAGKSINMNGYTITGQSDRSLKENINYVDRVKNETNLKDNFYNDFKNKFKFATYNYKKEDQKDRTHFGFIAQDIEDTSFSDYLLIKNKNENNEDVLGYDIQALINVYGSILQKEIEIRDNQIEDLTSRIAKLEKTILNSQG